MEENQLQLIDLDSYSSPPACLGDWAIDVGYSEGIAPIIDMHPAVAKTLEKESAEGGSGSEYSLTPEEPEYGGFSQQEFDDLTILPLNCGEFKDALKRATILSLLAAKEYLSKNLKGNKTRFNKIARQASKVKWQLEVFGFRGDEWRISNPKNPDSGQGDGLSQWGELENSLEFSPKGNSPMEIDSDPDPAESSDAPLGVADSAIDVVSEPLGDASDVESSDSNYSNLGFTVVDSSLTAKASVSEFLTERVPKKNQEQEPSSDPDGELNLSEPSTLSARSALPSSPISEVEASPQNQRLGGFTLNRYSIGKSRKCPYEYLRLSWKEGKKTKHLHIPGGNADSELVRQRVDFLKRAVKSGLDKPAIIDLVLSWRKPRKKGKKAKPPAG